MTLPELKNIIRGYLAKDQIESALNGLSTLLEDKAEIHDSIILQSGRAARVKQQERDGLIGQANANIINNQIRSAVNSMLEDIEPMDIKANAHWNASPTEDKQDTFGADINTQQQSGIKRQIELKVKVLNRIREALAIETDPARQVAYEIQIAQAEEEIEGLKKKLT